ncbi:MAG: hypothetical protein IKS31_05010 [Clostridia bacterium]|nr:hypothetical protein [Clostridia bacterium]
MADAKISAALNPVFLRIAEYYERALRMDWVRDKAAWAIYQAWRDVDSGYLRIRDKEGAHGQPDDAG